MAELKLGWQVLVTGSYMVHVVLVFGMGGPETLEFTNHETMPNAKWLVEHPLICRAAGCNCFVNKYDQDMQITELSNSKS